MASRDLTVRIDGDPSGFNRGMKSAEASAKAFERELNKMEATAKKSAADINHVAQMRAKYERDEAAAAAKRSAAMDQAGRAAMAFGAVAAAGVATAVRAFANFDQAMSKVQAATHASAATMDSLRDAALEAGARTAFSATEAAEGIEALSKAGVAAKDILNGGLNGALDLAAAGTIGVGEAAEIAATALTIFGLSGAQVPHVADLLAAAAGKAQGEVSDMGMALKQSGLVADQVGLSIEETTTVLASFASAGLIGSDAGTSLKTMLQRLTPTSEEAAGAMKELGFSAYDSQGNFVGLEELAREMQTSFSGLTDEQRNLEMATIFGSDAVRAASVLYEQGAAGIADWTEKVDDAGYAQETAAIKLDNLKGDFEAFTGSVETALIGAGSSANGALREITQFATGAVNAYGALPSPIQSVVTATGGISAALGLAGGAFMIAAPKVTAFKASLDDLGPKSQAFGRGLGAVTGALAGPLGLALSGGVIALGMYASAKAKAKGEVEAFTSAITTDSSALGENSRATAISALEKDGLAKVASDLGLDLERVVDAALGDARAMDEVTRATTEAVGAGVGMEGGLTRQAQGAQELGSRVGQLAERHREGVEASERNADAMGESGDAAKDAATATADLAVAQKASAEEAEKLAKAQEDAAKTLAGFVDPLSVYTQSLTDQKKAMQDWATEQAEGTKTAKDSWEDFASDVTVSLDEYNDALAKDLQAQMEWEQNLVKVAAKAGDGVAMELYNMGREAAPLVKAFADDTTGEFKRTADLINQDIARGSTNAYVSLEKNMAIMSAVGKSGGKATALAISTELGIGLDEVTRIAAQYGVKLAAGINPLLSALGRTQVAVGRAKLTAKDGRERPGYASGGAVWGAGTATSDSIPALLCNGEYVIRADSVDRYGHDFLDAVNQGRYALGGLVRRFAGGGFASAGAVPKPPSTKPYGPPISTAGDRTMAHAYGEASEFVKANAAPDLGGDAPGVSKMMAALREAFPGLALISGLRPGATTATGNPSYHGKGRAVDVPPSMAVFDWIARNYGSKSRELIFSPAGGRQINNGRPHIYSGITKAMHYDHVHWAMKNGGLVGKRPPARRASGGPIARATAPRTAPRTLTAATRGLTDPAAIRAAADAWDDYNRQLTRNRELLADAQAAQYELKIAKTTDARAAAQRKLADATRAIAEQQSDDRLDRERAAVDRLVDSLEREADARQKQIELRNDAKSALDDLLDAERDIRERGVEAEERYAERVATIQKRSAEAARDLAQQQQRLLDGRRDQLEGWASLDERAAMQWGNSVGQLIDNARSQAADFEQWSKALADARARGVSEQVIAALGLDEGPEALGQLKQFGQATAAEIDALNAEVARRTALAGAQASREQQAGYGELGRALEDAHRQYTEALAELNEELVEAQADLLVEQAEVANELAALGQNQARSYGEALEQGLRSQIPAVLAAAKALQAAAGGATTNASMAGGKYVDSLTGRLAYYGPNGQPGSATKTGQYAAAHRMPDGRTAYYNPSHVVASAPAAGSGGITVQINAPVFGVDQLNQTIRSGVQSALTEQRTAYNVAGSR